MKKAELVFTAILIPLDIIMLFLAGMVAYYLRFSPGVSEARPVSFDLPFANYISLVALTIPLFVFSFAVTGLYSTKISRPLWEEFLKIIVAVSASVMVITFFTFLRREIFSSRFIFIFAWIFAIVFIMFGRVIIKYIQRRLVGKYNYGVQRVLIIGVNKITKIISREIINRPGMGYRIIDKIDDFSLAELERLNKKTDFDEIIFCNPKMPYEKTLELLEFCIENRKDLKFVPAIFENRTANIEMQNIAGVPVIEFKKTPLDGWGKIIKRVFDIVVSFFCLLIFFPLMLIIALAIKLDSRGPVIYKNERVGARGVFETLKFRSMRAEYCIGRQFANNDDSLAYQEKLIRQKSVRKGPVYKIKDDPRVTRVGRFIRAASLDELPQFINVLKGEMSLVGPRPHQSIEVAKYSRHHKKVLTIKPGITGMAQISGRSDLDFDEEVRLDYYYIENWSIFLDLKILLKTPLAILAKRKAI